MENMQHKGLFTGGSENHHLSYILDMKKFRSKNECDRENSQITIKCNPNVKKTHEKLLNSTPRLRTLCKEKHVPDN